MSSRSRLLAAITLLIVGSSSADAASKIVDTAFKQGAEDGAACLPQDSKGGLQAFQQCIDKHVKQPEAGKAAQDSYLLGLRAETWALINLQAQKAWDAGSSGSTAQQEEAKKAANILLDVAHAHFLEMRKLQKKVAASDPDVSQALGLPYEALQAHFQFYENWK
ncbi:hypothetical protein ACFPL7_14270 [Dongia soli]|uniref:Uncharacterized protein n=1 Tax=Dongia soli TaxID=600628 RepID=A0ABU5EEP3_9PROT|nr:hypothetical protein [Dongia soli]MDY0883938.1 hypothetical protein [Dongia soli]